LFCGLILAFLDPDPEPESVRDPQTQLIPDPEHCIVNVSPRSI
jgi:hypothetical protein